MGLSDALIGQNMNTHPDCLGIYIGLDEIYMAQTSRKGGSVVLESLVRVPITDVDRSLLKPLDLNEAFFSMDGWTDSLGKIMAKKKWKTNRVAVSLSPTFCLLRHFVIPTVLERKLWKSSIPLQARKYIHFPFEKAAYAYYAYEFEAAATKQKRLGVVFAMTTQTIINQLRKGLRSCGLELISVEPSSLSLGRAFNDGDKEAVGKGGRIYSFFGKDMASFVFLNKNAPVFLREVEISGSLPVERRRFEIANCTEFIAKQLERDPFEEAVITGMDVDQWVPALEADSKKPVRKWNLSEIYGVETRSSGEIASVGASIKFLDNKTPDIDFTKGKRLSLYEFNASLTVWKIAAVLILLILLLIGKGYWDVYQKGRELKKKQSAHTDRLADFAGLTAKQIANNLNKIKTQNSNLQVLAKYNHYATPILAEVVNSIPPEVWVTKMTYNDVFPGQGLEERSITIEGSIKSGTGDGRNDMAIGNKFRDVFAAQPTIRKICDGEPVVRYTNIAGTGKTDSRAKEDETKFTLTCSKGGKR